MAAILDSEFSRLLRQFDIDPETYAREFPHIDGGTARASHRQQADCATDIFNDEVVSEKFARFLNYTSRAMNLKGGNNLE